MKLGFIGLGKMGGPMVDHLLRHGEQVTVYDINPDTVATAVAQGARAANCPRGVAEVSDAIITALPSVKHVSDVYRADSGIFAGLRPHALLIDCSTVSPVFSRQLQQEAVGLGAMMVDAPMSGGTKGAAVGALTFMVGAEGNILAAVRPILLKMGRTVVYCGGPGSGQVVKLCNNLVLASTMIATCEALSLGVRLGVAPEALSDALNGSSGRSWSSDTNNPWPGVMSEAPSSKDYEGGGSTATLLKDLELAVEAAKEIGQTLLLAPIARDAYQELASRGLANKDFSSVLTLFR